MTELRLPNQAKLTWEVDPAAFQEACEFLGVEWPVRVLQRHLTRIGGNHTVRRGHHAIVASRDVMPDTAGRTLWHELAHCAQAERLGSVEFSRQYRAQPSGWSLRLRGLNRFEVEADAAENWNAACPLAVFSARIRGLEGYPG